MSGHCSCFCRLLTFFSINFLLKKYFRNTVRLSNGLDPDQDQCDLDPNCFQWINADDKSPY